MYSLKWIKDFSLVGWVFCPSSCIRGASEGQERGLKCRFLFWHMFAHTSELLILKIMKKLTLLSLLSNRKWSNLGNALSCECFLYVTTDYFLKLRREVVLLYTTSCNAVVRKAFLTAVSDMEVVLYFFYPRPIKVNMLFPHSATCLL